MLSERTTYPASGERGRESAVAYRTAVRKVRFARLDVLLVRLLVGKHPAITSRTNQLHVAREPARGVSSFERSKYSLFISRAVAHVEGMATARSPCIGQVGINERAARPLVEVLRKRARVIRLYCLDDL